MRFVNLLWPVAYVAYGMCSYACVLVLMYENIGTLLNKFNTFNKFMNSVTKESTFLTSKRQS